MNEFKAKAIRFITPKDDFFEWLFIMQHHGTPTRLLDWSENAMVAIAFATQYRKDKHKDKDAVVWCLNPVEFNSNVNPCLVRPVEGSNYEYLILPVRITSNF